MKLPLAPQAILLPSPVLVIGTYGPDGRPDIMTAAWAGVASSNPPCVSVSLREATLTYHNIRETGAFTVNVPSERHLAEADFAGIVSGRACDKFMRAGLTPVKSGHVNAPLVAEFPYALECRLVRQVELGSHTMFIGEVVGLAADDDILDRNRLPDIEKVHPMMFAVSGARAYYGVGAKLGAAFSSGNALREGKIDDRL